MATVIVMSRLLLLRSDGGRLHWCCYMSSGNDGVTTIVIGVACCAKLVVAIVAEQ